MGFNSAFKGLNLDARFLYGSLYKGKEKGRKKVEIRKQRKTG